MYKVYHRISIVWVVSFVVIVAGCGMSPEQAQIKGDVLYDRGQHVDAQPLLEKALAGGIDDPELIVRTAYLRATINDDPTSAIEILRDSALRYPTYARTFNQLGVIAYLKGPVEHGANLRQAIDFTLKANILDTTDWKIMDNIGTYYGKLGVLDTAVIWLKAAQQIEPDYPKLNSRLAELESYLESQAGLDTLAEGDTLTFGS